MRNDKIVQIFHHTTTVSLIYQIGYQFGQQTARIALKIVKCVMICVSINLAILLAPKPVTVFVLVLVYIDLQFSNSKQIDTSFHWFGGNNIPKFISPDL